MSSISIGGDVNECKKSRLGKTDLMIDSLGVGCSTVGNNYRAMSDAEAAETLKTTWNNGLRYYDTAPHYGQGLSERRVGEALRPHAGEHYILSTKVGRLLKPAGYATERHGFFSPMPFDFIYDYSYDGVMRSFEDSLQRLGLDNIDVLYMHDIGALTHGEDNASLFSIAMNGGYRAMDELRRNGQVTAIGLGVNEYEVCEAALDYGDWDCFMLAGRYTLLEQECLDTFLPKCEERECSIVVAAPYNSGILAKGVRGSGPWHYDYGPAPDEVVNKVRAIEDICEQFNVPLAAAALQFPLTHPAVVSVVPGIGGARRAQQTLDLFKTDIPDELWTALIEQSLLRDTTQVR